MMALRNRAAVMAASMMMAATGCTSIVSDGKPKSGFTARRLPLDRKSPTGGKWPLPLTPQQASVE